jgi:hypothetical protein
MQPNCIRGHHNNIKLPDNSMVEMTLLNRTVLFSQVVGLYSCLLGFLNVACSDVWETEVSGVTPWDRGGSARRRR